MHHVQEADAELMRREKDFKEKCDAERAELEAESISLDAGQQQLADDQAEVRNAKIRLAKNQKQLQEREAKLARQPMVDREVQTPMFRDAVNGTCFWLCCWTKRFLFLALPAIIVYASPWRPHIFSALNHSWQQFVSGTDLSLRIQLQDDHIVRWNATHMQSLLQRLGTMQQCQSVQCPPCPKQPMQLMGAGSNMSALALTDLCAKVPAALTTKPNDLPWKFPLKAMSAVAPCVLWLATP